MAGGTIYIEPRLTEHDILLRGGREYELYLRDRLTEVEIFIQSIPYRELMSVENSTIAGNIIRYLHQQKQIAIRSGATASAEIDRIFAVVSNRIANAAIASSSVLTAKTTTVDVGGTAVAGNIVRASYLLLAEFASSACAGSSIGDVDVRHAVGNIISGAVADSSVRLWPVHKFDRIDAATEAVQSISICTNSGARMESGAVAGSSISIGGVRHRMLSEVDSLTLEQMDSMTLEDLDYITIF